MLARYTGVTDPGRRRRRNEDAYVCVPPLFAIADGMGGAQAGEVASRLAAAVLEEATGDAGGGAGEERVVSLIREANRRVFQRSSEDAATSGMGTTMTVALVDASDDTIAFGHVGDSRAYRVRGGELEQLTDDHSLVGELVRSGRLSPEEAETHPQRAVITRALGTEPDVDIDTFTVDAEPDDIYLLCSDGLTDMISADDILSLVAGSDDLETAARALVNAANAGGGEDNITVVLFQIDGGGDGGDTAQMPVAVAHESQPDEAAYDDEDTLSPLDNVPAVDTAVVPAAAVQEELRRTETRRGRRREQPERRVLPLVALIVLLVLLLLLAAWGLSR